MTTTTAATGAADPYAALGLDRIGATRSDVGTESANRFLKMLVAQMQNQDPLNPMDNAQVTSQMAQINTVAGLEQVNMSVRALNTQLLQSQALQGAALVGRDVAIAGDRLAIDDGKGRGGFDLAGSATAVRVEIVGAGGRVVGNVPLGGLPAGRHFFEWNAGSTADSAGLTFRVVADNAGTPVAGRSLAIDRVEAISTDGEALMLSLRRSGTLASTSVLAFR